MATNFRELSAALDARLDALPNGEGNRIRGRAREDLERELAAFEELVEARGWPGPGPTGDSRC